MSLNAEKQNLIEWITKLDDSAAIAQLAEIKSLYADGGDWYDNLQREEKESIRRGLEDIKNGRVRTHDSVRKIYEKYL